MTDTRPQSALDNPDAKYLRMRTLSLCRVFDPDVKRLNVPTVFSDHCPECGKRCVVNLSGEDYLSSPMIGYDAARNEMYFYCGGSDGCGAEWQWTYELRVEVLPRERVYKPRSS